MEFISKGGVKITFLEWDESIRSFLHWKKCIWFSPWWWVACLIWCSFYWRWRNPTTIRFSSLSPLFALCSAAFTGSDVTYGWDVFHYLWRFGLHITTAICVLVVKCAAREFNSTFFAWRMQCSFEYVEWNGKSIYFPSPSAWHFGTEFILWELWLTLIGEV